MKHDEISRDRGTYIVILHSRVCRAVSIGARGPLRVQPGYYLYVGSALGPGGLRARLGRHLSGTGRPRWHVDFLRQVTKPTEAWLTVGNSCEEHHWAKALANTPGITPVEPGLGASDCGCTTHLFYTRSAPVIGDFNGSLCDLGLEANARPLRRSLQSAETRKKEKNRK